MKPHKLTRLLLLITFTVIIQKFSDAQIVYTDVNPDVASSGTYDLDLNNDGTADFVIKHTTKSAKGTGKCKGQSGTNHYISVTPLNNNRVLDYNGANARMMTVDELIDASASTWNKNHNQVVISYEWDCRYICIWSSCGYFWITSSSGQWYPGDGYLGLKLISGGHTYYGWVQINIPYGADNFIIKDYAINNAFDQPIFAGQSSTEHLLIPANASSEPMCAGNSVVVPYIITGTFSASNEVTVELSDASGSFENPVTIGSVVSNVSGNINGLIPANTPSGYGYRIRLTSSDPARTSYPNGENLQVVGELPYADIYSTNNISNLCVAGNVHLEAVTQSCNSYQWKFNGNNIPGATTSSFDAGVVGDYSCEITNGVGTVISNIITINSEPPSITIYEDHANCNGNVVVYAIDDNSDNSLSNFQWRVNGNDIPGATSFAYNASTTGDYSCVKSNNCGSTTSNTITVTNDLIFMADATITPDGPTAMCSGQVTLNANEAAGVTYQWYDGYDPIPGATNSSYTASVSGGYSIREINSSGCLRDNTILILIGAPTINIASSSPPYICNNNPVNLYTFYNWTYEESNATSFSLQWIKDGSDISGATGSQYDAREPGTYSVRVTLNPGGCSSTSAEVQITDGCPGATTATSLTSNEPENSVFNVPKLNVAPNPTASQTQISFTTSKAGKVLLNVFDIDGKLIKTIADRNFEAGPHHLLFDAKDLKAGVYILNMQSQGSVQTKKLILIK